MESSPQPSPDPEPPPSDAAPHAGPVAGLRFGRRSGLIVLFGLIFVAIGLILSPKLPHDQTVHIVLGSGAGRVNQLQVRYYGPLPDEDPGGYFAREATFRYGQGVIAPRIVDHSPRLADGDYLVEIAVSTDAGNTTVSRQVHLAEGHSASIDLVAAIHEVAP
ncbi:hypothetical protein LVJ94_19690 [Pendulispora rubella]|uniref:Uncharacterized protein n=1 Tax=Pendulispora rubella TaxID=2741070 RepID=A0ABZ2LET3_9BACT